MKSHPPLHGFDLMIGYLYNDGWQNDKITGEKITCKNCGSEEVEVFKLKKYVFAWGMTIIKRKTLVACTDCYNEIESTTKEVKGAKSKRKSTKLQTSPNVEKFMSLSKEQQQALLKMVKS